MRIGKIFGIEITVHVTWLFVFALVVWSLASDLGPFHALQLDPLTRAVLAVFTAVLFFASVLVHELAHSLVARRAGIPVSGITLFIFGGVSRFEQDPATAPVAAWTAFVGPLTSLVLAAIFYALATLFGVQTPIGDAFGYLAFANLALGLFNLLPAYPLDGGRVLHAILWQVTRDRLRATRISVNVGRVLASLLVALGIVETLAYGFGGGLWLTFIGWFLLQAGSAEAMQAELTSALQGHAVSELAETPAVTIPADMTAEAALRTMIDHKVRAAPVMVGERLAGLLTFADFSKDPARAPSEKYVTSIMTREADLTTVPPDAKAVDVMRLLGQTGFHQLPIVASDGRFLGLVTREGIVRWLAFERDHRVTSAVERHA